MIRSPAGPLSTLLFLALSSHAVPARANMAPPIEPGEPIAEPAPLLAGLHIVHEDLRIDLRPLEHGGNALIRARYQVRNDGAQRRLELFFVAPGLRQGRVVHKGREVPAEPVTRTVPELGQKPHDPAEWEGLAFVLELVPGSQSIEVEYQARPGSTRREMVRSYFVNYVLAPARRWASFGTLRIELYVPDGWDVLEIPAQLAARNDRFEGAFDGSPPALESARDVPWESWELASLPADTLRVHVAPHVPLYGLLRALMIALQIAGLLVPIALVVWLRSRRRSPLRWLASIGGSLVLVPVFMLVVPDLLPRVWIPDAHLSPPGSYPPGPYLGFALLLMAALIIVVAHVAAALPRRRRAG